ncbi:type I-E CRISPR-associated protein Cas6/Cse3/CasE [Silanimonas sp.]|uniref:type I-E CRISPR-associated protein Cas6/Cse3/CasE n=1 Tax=Silanimonas sp. TaxID=1929290 RepID=UPI001BC49B37|nr:type I-E CRISPR-associated protein Cas6/Cse3/CasE [Silanimonas sp.]MBS3896248.1 type I-E CRISPR-associated protein Cas6/Cse3/CasE [Silanimonas sp.]
MYLSKLRLDRRCSAVRRDLGNPWELHRSLWSAFPADLAALPERVLWRLELERDGSAQVLVQSQLVPTWEALLGKYPGYTSEPVACKPYQPLLLEGQNLRFRLRTNCSVKRDGKRRAVVGEAEQLAWLARHGERGGFVVDAAEVRDEGTRAFRKGDHQAKLSVALFDGCLRVQQREAFLATLSRGIGHSKGLGLGLLSIAPMEA